MAAKMVDVFVDSNESVQNPRILKKLKKTLPVVVKKLPAGDYWIPPVLIERKAIGDFFGSWTDGHLQEQMERMRTVLKSAPSVKLAILYEGSVEEFLKHRRKWRMSSINAILYSVVFDWGFKLLPTDDEDHTVEMLQYVYKHLTTTKQYVILPLRTHKKKRTLYERQRFIVEGFPQVGVTRAIKLLETFKSVRGVVNAKAVDITRLPRFPRKVAEEIVCVSSSPWRPPKKKRKKRR